MPVKVVYAVEGTIFPGQSVQIIKGAPHMENAKKFVDYRAVRRKRRPPLPPN